MKKLLLIPNINKRKKKIWIGFNVLIRLTTILLLICCLCNTLFWHYKNHHYDGSSYHNNTIHKNIGNNNNIINSQSVNEFFSMETDQCVIRPKNHNKKISHKSLLTAGGRILCQVRPCSGNVSGSSSYGIGDESIQLSSHRVHRGFAITDVFAIDEYNNINLVPKHQQMRRHGMQIGGSARAGSGCALSQKYKFFFIHNLKVGGITTKGFLKKALCSSFSANTTDLSIPTKEKHRQSDTTTATRTRRLYERYECNAGDDTLEIINCSKGLKIAQEHNFLIFSFVRNPYSRLYSGYAMAINMEKQRQNQKKMVYKHFTFMEFALANQPQRSKMSITSHYHYLPQAKFLTDTMNCPIFDYIGRLESYEDDLLTILIEIERRYVETNETMNKNDEHASNIYTYDISGTKITPKTPLLKYYFETIRSNQYGRIPAARNTSFGKKRHDKEKQHFKIMNEMDQVYTNQDVVEKVYQEYKVDFDTFGYEKDDIPLSNTKDGKSR